MVSNVAGLMIGAGIDRDEGGEGFAGAREGYMIEGTSSTIAQLVVTFAIRWGVPLLARRAFDAITGKNCSATTSGHVAALRR